jgi:protein required for attachment to host cells
MKHDWILIANATHARLLQRRSTERIDELKRFEHPQSRSKTSDVASDRAGHQSADHSYGGTMFQPRTDPRQKEPLRFARELAGYLEREALQGSFGSLEVFASSPFLGQLKAELGSATNQLLAGTHAVDLTAVGKAELARRIAHELAAH